MTDVHLYNQTDKLRKVILGNFFPPEYFDDIENHKLKNSLQKILAEIQEDLDNFEKILTNHGVEVFRPELHNEKFNYQHRNFAPLIPRNYCHVIGDQFVILNDSPTNDSITKFINPDCIVDLTVEIKAHLEIAQKNNQYYKENNLISKEKYMSLAGPSWPLFDNFLYDNYSCNSELNEEFEYFRNAIYFYDSGFRGLEGPNIIVCKDQILLDQNEYCHFEYVLKERLDIDTVYTPMNLGSSHTDGIFMILNDDTILSIPEQTQLIPKKFKNKIIVPNENYHSRLYSFQKSKNITKGRWWIPGKENDDELNLFIDQYLRHWVGYVEETIFDVNVLPLDKNTVFTSVQDNKCTDLLKSNGITPIHVPWRHRAFIDSGIHCITLDLWREE